jgi:hypothetical protein
MCKTSQRSRFWTLGFLHIGQGLLLGAAEGGSVDFRTWLAPRMFYMTSSVEHLFSTREPRTPSIYAIGIQNGEHCTYIGDQIGFANMEAVELQHKQ